MAEKGQVEIIALLYHYRWTIEIFFRTFKHLLGCRHLLSHNGQVSFRHFET